MPKDPSDDSGPPARARLVARTSGLAVASLTLACVAVALSLCGMCNPVIVVEILPAIPAVICGHLALAECKRHIDVVGDGYAIAGLVIGYVCIGLAVTSVLGFLVTMLTVFAR